MVEGSMNSRGSAANRAFRLKSSTGVMLVQSRPRMRK